MSREANRGTFRAAFRPGQEVTDVQGIAGFGPGRSVKQDDELPTWASSVDNGCGNSRYGSTVRLALNFAVWRGQTE